MKKRAAKERRAELWIIQGEEQTVSDIKERLKMRIGTRGNCTFKHAGGNCIRTTGRIKRDQEQNN